MKLFRLAGLVLAGLVVAALPGCGGRSSKTQVAFVSNNPEEFWSICERGASKAADETGVELLFRRPSEAAPSEQKQIIDSLLAEGVSAVAVSVIDPKNQADYLNSVAERVPLIAVDNDAPNTKRLCYIGTDNVAAGKAVGELVKKVMPKGGTIAIFVGQIEPLNARERRQGVLEALAGKKDAGPDADGKIGPYKLHGVGAGRGPFTDGGNRKKAKENADDVLVQLEGEPDVCLVGLWAYNPPAILAAVETKRLQGKVKIVAFDEDKETLRGIREGSIAGTVVQQPYQFGYQSVKVMAALAKGDRSLLPKDGLMPVPHRLITHANVDEFQGELNKLLGK
jgi:ribose transport system substrate-binding protein